MTSPVNVSTGSPLDADSAADWFRLHGKRVAALAGTAIVLGGAFWFYRYNKVQNEIRAEAQYYQAEQSLLSGNLPLAQSDLQKVVTRYDGTRAADQARLGLAQALYGQKKFADGLKTLEPVAGGSTAFGAAAEALRAAGYEEMGKPKDAGDHYRAAADATALITDKSVYLADAARAYAAGGQRDSAVAIWTRLSEDLRSTVAAEARVRLGELTAVPVGSK
jgi:predicted negative regulator of RcsB-dependent stress response